MKNVRVIFQKQPTDALKHAARLFVRQVQDRCQAQVGIAEEPCAGCFTVMLAIEGGIGAEGFRIEDGGDRAVRIVGNDERGVLYGIGKFLRTSRFDSSGFTPGKWRGTSVPKCPIRMIYLATHFRNFYETAPDDELVRYIEDLGLWGYNTVLVHYPMFQYSGIADPVARQWLERVKMALGEARKRGLQVGLLQCPNQGYKTTPPELLGKEVKYVFGGNLGFNMCAAKPEAMNLLAKIYGELFDEFRDIGLDYYVTWPYDEGGCGCEKCVPWGARGYLDVSRLTADLACRRFPACKVILSTWCFEDENDANPFGEWTGLEKALETDKSWIDGLMADGHDDYFPAYVLKDGAPGGLPLVNFPEISMFKLWPWGGYGVNPAPAHFQMLWNRIKAKATGGAPYSEGIFEDINKAIWAQFYWDPNQTAEETVREYAAFEFAPEIADDALAIVRIFEQNHQRKSIKDSARRAFDLVLRSEGRLTEQARKSWRWRLFFLRALIDKEMFERHGKIQGEEIKAAFEEICRIYHVEKATWERVRPPAMVAERKS